jgi:hypothetical protein
VFRIAELAVSVLNSNRKISKHGVDSFIKHKNVLRRLVDKDIAVCVKKNWLALGVHSHSNNVGVVASI